MFSDVKSKLRDLCNLYERISDGAANRNARLEETLDVADRFWDDLHALSRQLKDLSDTLASQEPPALEPSLIREQQEALEVQPGGVVWYMRWLPFNFAF